MEGYTSVSSAFDGSFGFTVYLGGADGYHDVGEQRIPDCSVIGGMSGGFNAEISSLDRLLSGRGTVSYFLGGVYDPARETIRVRLRPSGVEAAGKQTVLRSSSRPASPPVTVFSMNWNTGRRSPMDDSYGDLPKESVMLEPPALPAFRDHEAKEQLLNCVPQTDELDRGTVDLDLRNPDPQVVTQTREDRSLAGTHIITWTFALVPLFSIERTDPPMEAEHSFLSSDLISLRVSIPGVTIAGSQWESLVSWRVAGASPSAGNGTPTERSRSAVFAFRPDPSNRPRNGSAVRNRPLSYDIVATIEGTTQHYFLKQDEIDTLRQEYIDHGMPSVPKRGEFVSHPVDGEFNLGNYGFVLDNGMREALGAISEGFGQSAGASVKVLGGYLSPQRNKLAGGHSWDGRSYGRSLDLVPQPANPNTFRALRQVCLRAGYKCACEGEPNVVVPCESPAVKRLHVVWSSHAMPGSRATKEKLSARIESVR